MFDDRMNTNSLCLFGHDNCLPTHVSPWPHIDI